MIGKFIYTIYEIKIIKIDTFKEFNRLSIKTTENGL